MIALSIPLETRLDRVWYQLKALEYYEGIKTEELNEKCIQKLEQFIHVQANRAKP